MALLGRSVFPLLTVLEPDSLFTVGLSAGLQQIPGEIQQFEHITGNNL